MTNDDPTMPDLFQRARTGDSDALGQLLQRHWPALCRKAGPQLGIRLASRLSASDLAAEATLAAIKDWATCKGTTSKDFANWLYGILAKKVGKVIRDHALTEMRDVRKERRLEDEDAACQQLQDGQRTPCTQAIWNEEQARLRAAVAELPANQRRAVELRHFKGLSLEQIAQEMQKSSPAVAGLIKRGINTLHAKLGAPLEETET